MHSGFTMMTNTIRALLALCTPALVLTCTLLSACAAGEQGLVRGALRGPTLAAAALSSEACAQVAEPESDAYWQCFEQRETQRCLAEGWCD